MGYLIVDGISKIFGSGDTAVVGAHYDDENGVFAGSAYLFDCRDPYNCEQWAKMVSLHDYDPDRDLFGVSVVRCVSCVVGQCDRQ